MNELTVNTLVVRGANHVETEVDNQTLMMSVVQGKYYALEASAKRIWELVACPIELKRVVATLVNEYDVDEKRCQSDVLAFAELLLRNGLIVESRR